MIEAMTNDEIVARLKIMMDDKFCDIDYGATEAAIAALSRAPMELTDSEWWKLFEAMDLEWACSKKPQEGRKEVANAARQWLAERGEA